MQIVTPEQMMALEVDATQKGACEASFMEEAGLAIAAYVQRYIMSRQLPRIVTLLCGKGNNAGDAYVAARHLLHAGFLVDSLQFFPLEAATPLCRCHAARFLSLGGKIEHVSELEAIALPSSTLLLDGIFGTGFRGELSSFLARTIHTINNSGLPAIAIDIPSGLHGSTGLCREGAIRANATLFLGLPKQGFFLNEGWEHVGALHAIDFGLERSYTAGLATTLLLTTEQMLMALLPPLVRTRHKYSAGYVVGIAGSPAMPGAAILSAVAALRGGAGVVRLACPEDMTSELAQLPPEILRHSYKEGLESLWEQVDRAQALFIGPGMGRSAAASSLVGALFSRLKSPCVVDADALTAISEQEPPKWPSQLVLTPHWGEMARLLHSPPIKCIDIPLLQRCQCYVEGRGITLVLKGAPTFIFHSKEAIRICPWGGPGMATAGSGDVLTGLIASLLAQGLSPHVAATLGVSWHAMAGDIAAELLTPYYMNASDILSALPTAIKHLHKRAMFTSAGRISVKREAPDGASGDKGIALAIAEEPDAPSGSLAADQKLTKEVNMAHKSFAEKSATE